MLSLERRARLCWNGDRAGLGAALAVGVSATGCSWENPALSGNSPPSPVNWDAGNQERDGCSARPVSPRCAGLSRGGAGGRSVRQRGFCALSAWAGSIPSPAIPSGMEGLQPIQAGPYPHPRPPSKAPQGHHSTLGTVSERGRGRGKLQEPPTPSSLANSASGEQQKEIKS